MFPKSKEEVEFGWKILVLSCLISLFVNYDPLGAREGAGGFGSQPYLSLLLFLTETF